jgi:hypothetical protein
VPRRIVDHVEPHLRVRKVLEPRHRLYLHLAALSLLLLLGSGCGDHRSAGFCGLAHTVNGYDYVAASDLACAEALHLVPRFERGFRGAWACSRSVGGGVELVCISRKARIELLERSPVPARRKGPVVRLANVTFRLGRRPLAGHGPWCVPDVPREVLRAFGLRAVTPDGGCYAARR